MTSPPGPPIPGDWAVCRIPGPSGDMIERMQRLSGGGARASKWVHAIYLVAPGVIVEATPHGTRRNKLTYPPAALAWSTGLISKDDRARQASIAEANEAATANGGKGVPYSYLDYAAIALHCWHIPAPGLRIYIEAGGHAICSQAVDSFELAGGTHLFRDGRWAGFVRPLDLADLISAP